jgi:PAS domain S-box-containing protein
VKNGKRRIDMRDPESDTPASPEPPETEQISGLHKEIEVLRSSEEKYRTIFENCGIAMVIIEKDTTISRANNQFQILSGYSREEIEGKKSWTDFVAVEDLERMKEQHQKRRELRNSALKSYEFRFISRYGELHHILLNVDLIPGTTRSVASLLDITDRKRMEESLCQVDTRMKLMSSITRHDIRNKVTVLNGYLALIEDLEDSSEIRDLINAMKDTIASVQNQISFSKIYQDIGVRKPEWVRIREILPVSHIPPSVSFVIDIPDLEIYADPMLEKVFENLLENSIRHGDGLRTIRISADHPGNELLIIWEDDGKGIPDGEKSLIFERGYGKNTGLGLYLIENILGITGLTIRENGLYGKGARFEICCYLGSYRIRQGD